MNSRSLCVVPNCFTPGRHESACQGNCRGCLPGLAVDGGRVCLHHTDRALQDLTRLPGLDAALTVALNPIRGTVLAQFRQHGGSKNPGLDLNPNVVEHREFLRERLAAFVSYAVIERGITGPPAWDVPAVAGWLRRHHDWFCASQMAGPYVHQLSSLARKSYGLAYPSGVRKFEICACIEHTTLEETGERLECVGVLWAVLRPDTGLLPSELTCDTDPEHTYAPGQWLTLGRKLHGPAAIHAGGAARLTGRIGA